MKIVHKNNISVEDYKKLFDTFYVSLCIFSSKYTKSLDLSKDVVQEVFIALWNKQIQFEDTDNIKSYLYTSVRNKSLDLIKNKAFQSKVQLEPETLKSLTSQTYFEKQVLTEETYRIVNEAVNTLPKKCKRIIHLSLKGLENKQISEELSISLNTVKTQKRIAYQKLRPLLKSAYLIFINIMFFKF